MRKNSRQRIIRLFSTIVITMGVMLMLYPLYSDLLSIWYEDKLHTALTASQEADQSDLTSTVPKTATESKGLILDIPAINLSTAIQKGTSTETLKKTPGWFEESKLPGQGNTAIAGHRNMYGNWFRNLDKLNKGDIIYLQHEGYRYMYEIEGNFQVESTEVDIIKDCGYPALTLTTCLEDDSSHRLVIRAKLIDSLPIL